MDESTASTVSLQQKVHACLQVPKLLKIGIAGMLMEELVDQISFPIVNVMASATHFAKNKAWKIPSRIVKGPPGRTPGHIAVIISGTLQPDRLTRLHIIGQKRLQRGVGTVEAHGVPWQETHAAHETAEAKARCLPQVEVQGSRAPLR